VNFTLYPERCSRRVRRVYAERLARRARSRPLLGASSIAFGSARTFFPQGSTFDRRRALARFFSAPCPFNFQPSIVNSPASPLFVAFPYISPASPLSSAFTHSHGGGRAYFFPVSRIFWFQVYCFSFVFSSLPPLASLFAVVSPFVFFIFSNLQTLFCRPGGWAGHMSSTRLAFNHPFLWLGVPVAGCGAWSARRVSSREFPFRISLFQLTVDFELWTVGFGRTAKRGGRITQNSTQRSQRWRCAETSQTLLPAIDAIAAS
jgi:hypothetical protein